MPDVRRVQRGDASTLRAIRLAALRSDPDAFSATLDEEARLSDQDWLDRVHRASSGDEAATFVAYEDNTATGLVTMLRSRRSSASTELVSMWTEVGHRSSGTGTALVKAGVEWARAAGCASVRLWVMSDNEAARRFYEHRGFVEIEPGDVGAADPCRDQIRMERRL